LVEALTRNDISRFGFGISCNHRDGTGSYVDWGSPEGYIRGKGGDLRASQGQCCGCGAELVSFDQVKRRRAYNAAGVTVMAMKLEQSAEREAREGGL
jgi:hypothetical protein